MQIKSTIRYYLTPIKMATMKKKQKITCWKGCGEIRTLVHYWQDVTVWQFLRMLKIELPYDLGISLQIHLKELKAGTQGDICIRMSITWSAIAKIWKQSTEWMNGETKLVCTCNKILFHLKKEGNSDIWMNIEGIMLSEGSQAQEDKYSMISLIWST